MADKRLFAAIDLPEEVEHALTSLNPRIDGMRWTHGAHMHLTLGFFGHLPAEIADKLSERLSAISFRAFFLPITGLGSFPTKGPPKIIWVGVGSGHPHLFQLHKRVQEAALTAGIEPDLRPWHPHITLARCRDVPAQVARKFFQKHEGFDAGMIRVEEFHLYSSALTPAGSVYTRELTVHCSGGLPVAPKQEEGG